MLSDCNGFRPAFVLSAFVKSITCFSIDETEALVVASAGFAGFSGVGAGAGFVGAGLTSGVGLASGVGFSSCFGFSSVLA